MSDAANRLADVRRRIADACHRAGREAGSVRLVAVSKSFPAGRLAEFAEAGQSSFGESYLQEAIDKIGPTETLAARQLDWHFIGPIQGNKCRPVAAAFGWVHGVDRLKIAERLSALRGADQPPLNLLVQVNVSGEASKGGVAPAEAEALCLAIAPLPKLRLRGLMCIPAPVDEAQQSRPAFARLRALREAIRSRLPDPAAFDQLSMGMSDDFEVAVEEGATMVRVGSALFGARH